MFRLPYLDQGARIPYYRTQYSDVTAGDDVVDIDPALMAIPSTVKF